MAYLDRFKTVPEWAEWAKDRGPGWICPFEYWLKSFLNDRQKLALEWFICEQTELAIKKSEAARARGERQPASLYGVGGGAGLSWEVTPGSIGTCISVTNWYTKNSLDLTDTSEW